MPIDSLLTNQPIDEVELGVEASRQHDVVSDLQKQAMFEPVNAFLARPSKGFRAELVELSFQIAGGSGEIPLRLVEAIEILHAGSLIIDDIEDGSTHRRGAQALHRIIGDPLAINAGNWMYFQALEILTSLPLRESALSTIAHRTTKTVRQCHEGQALDLSARVDLLRQEDIESVVGAITNQKTGGLMALSAWLGATAARGDSEITFALDEFGMRLGRGLQMINDLAELRATEQQGGRCDDFRNRRVTWPWAWLAQLASTSEFSRLQAELSRTGDSPSRQRLALKLLQRVEGVGRTTIQSTLLRAYCDLFEKVGDSQPIRTLNQIISRMELGHV